MRGQAIGILNTANTAPQVIAPLLAAGIVAIGTGYRPVLAVSFVFIAIGAFSIFKIRSAR